MKCGVKLKKYENCILALAVMAVNVICMGVFFDFYYDLNDDTLMHDIMSGIYTGTPDGHNMQTLYPLGALIALCYRICRTVPWYGLFLCLCQFGSLYLVGVRLCDMQEGGGWKMFTGKIFRLLLLSLFQWVIWLEPLICIQYTITCAMLSAAAAFLFLTIPARLDRRSSLIKSVMPILLALVAFMLRSEMFLLAFPFVCLAGFYRMTAEKKIFDRENLIRYGGVLGAVLAGMLVLGIADYAAYSSDEWRDFRRFFDARTTVYDFYPALINEDAYSGELTRLGVTQQQQRLLRAYNFGLDNAIDTEFFEKLADCAAAAPGLARDYTELAGEKLYEYLYRTTHADDAPYNTVVLAAYAAVLLTGLAGCRKNGTATDDDGQQSAARRYAFVWQLLLLLIVRSALWLFILFRGRDPERITHSLYLLEFVLLAAMLACRWRAVYRESGRVKAGLAVCGAVMLGGVFAVQSPDMSVAGVRADQDARSQVNADWYAVDAYCRKHRENFYFEDVYSTVRFSRRMFERMDNSRAGYDTLGGWICKSPLYRDKLKNYGIEAGDDALLLHDNVYFIISEQEFRGGGVDTVTAYYDAKNIKVMAEQIDRIGDGYSVWQFTRAE